jgi:hypothetical protein
MCKPIMQMGCIFRGLEVSFAGPCVWLASATADLDLFDQEYHFWN